MNTEDFQASLGEDEPPTTLVVPLKALWWDAKGNWAAAHSALQSENGVAAAWVHGYLHRKEGDVSNATYWYRRAGKAMTKGPLEAERNVIVENLLNADQTQA